MSEQNIATSEAPVMDSNPLAAALAAMDAAEAPAVAQEASQEAPESTEAAPPEETPAPEAAAAPEVTETPEMAAARKFAERARKEREFREADIHRKQIEAQAKEVAEMQRLLREDPVAFLEKSGLKYDDWARSLANHKPKTEVDEVKSKVEQLEAQLRAAQEAEARAKEAQAAEQVKNTLVSAIKSDSTFELINSLDMHDTVIEAMQAHDDRTGEIRDVAEVAKEVETWLEGLVAKATATSKVKSKLPEILPKPAVQKRDVATLTNAQAGAAPVRKESGLLSREESIAAAAKLIAFSED